MGGGPPLWGGTPLIGMRGKTGMGIGMEIGMEMELEMGMEKYF